MVKKDNKKESTWQSFRQLLKMKRVMWDSIFFSICIGMGWTVLTLFQTLLPSSYSTAQIGVVGMVFTAFGIIGGISGSIYVEKNADSGNFDKIIKAFTLISFCSLLFLSGFMNSSNEYVVTFLCAIAGFGLISFVPFACQSLAESFFPLEETVVVSFMYYFVQIFSLIATTIASTSFVGDKGMWVVAIFIFPCLVYILFFFKTDYKRRNLEKEHSLKLAAMNTELRDIQQGVKTEREPTMMINENEPIIVEREDY